MIIQSATNYTYSYNKNNQLLQETEYVAGSGNDYSGYFEIVKNYTYDENGNTIKVKKSGQVDESVIQYTYDEWNWLIQYQDEDDKITSYGYNGTGMRISKTSGDITQKYYWDRGYISNEAEGAAFTAANYIGIQGIFARQTQDTTDYIFKNGHGDVVSLVNDGSVVKTYDYDAYGTQKNSNSADNNPFRYCGEYTDEETGLVYLRNRYYDSSTGRFITEDPVKDGLNWYAYCSGNPVMFFDPLGLDAGDLQVNGNDIYQTTIYDKTTYGSIRSFVSAIGGDISSNGNGIYSVKVGNMYMILDDIGVDDSSTAIVYAPVYNRAGDLVKFKETGKVDYKKVLDANDSNYAVYLGNMQQIVNAFKDYYAIELSYNLGDKGGKYYSDNILSNWKYTVIPKSLVKDYYDNNKADKFLNGLSGGLTSGAAYLLASFVEDKIFNSVYNDDKKFMNFIYRNKLGWNNGLIFYIY